ncbi:MULTISPECIES: hypothetical protein [Xanthomonas]|nr:MULTISPECIES: hypothetical protein [Xanthomonas]MDO6949949.1 hypothetical protein [Xanthomonas vasicola]MDO6962008.1 hypothetical protein [Xanthomonas vasicola]MEB1776552.1 hypothetical protein [Xanthomonas campestris pv. campestris]MEB2217014.1 hypothetical protein [Xanthomonas campestris pv. campestris]
MGGRRGCSRSALAAAQPPQWTPAAIASAAGIELASASAAR